MFFFNALFYPFISICIKMSSHFISCVWIIKENNMFSIYSPILHMLLLLPVFLQLHVWD